ncbi:SusC/RagA family TonB-linked outer membrane protein [Flammeovirgaceae bacterium SG7u.111]|nr:SusC/RagA family TonB-linked outer membrane protein [Flammeovirgaceae bacterium SG7u.132]WPO37006.1 SusC/RagA family TonB-linked outer membrane protein [Flammeovirgaceae bacterium SG7u.111]
MMIKRLLLLMTLSVIWLSASAQEKTISGTVIAETDQSPLPGVNVLVKGTSIGTITDIDGKFTLAVPGTASTLVFSYIGFESQEVELGSTTSFSISLKDDAKELTEVVVTALGIERDERSLGYAVTEVGGEDLSTARESNIVNSLSGRVAGVQVTGTPTFGGSANIRIRGVNSVTQGNGPLFVIDGTPIDNSNRNSSSTQSGAGGYDYGNAASDINPDDIESMSVLKGASAAALYGSRAANGVILITTKSGKSRKGIGVSFNGGVTFNQVYNLPDYQNEYGGGYKQEFDLYEGEPVVNYAADESWGPRMDGQMVRQWYSWYEDDPNYGKQTPFVAHPDNIKDFYETGVTQNYNISLDGGNEKSSFRMSYTYLDQTGTIPNSSQKRNNVTFRGDTKLTDKLSAGISATYVRTDTYGRPSTGYGAGAGNVVTSFNQWFQRQIDMDQLKNYKTADGIDRTWNIKSPTDLDPLYWENPYWVLNESPQQDYRERVYGNAYLGYEIIPNLTVKGIFRTDFYTDRREERVAPNSIPLEMYSESVRNVTENNFEFLAQYSKDITPDFSLSAMFGANHRNQIYYNNSANTEGGLSVPGFYNIEASIDRPSITDYRSEKVVNSIYGSANFGWRDLVYVDFTARNDWSSTLPIDKNSYFYPSVSTSFVFSELLPSNNILSFGKARVSWARVGNDTDAYNLYNVYGTGNNYGSNPAFYLPNTLNNDQLKPEQTDSWEAGLDLRFFNSRVNLDATYYSSVSTDQILQLDVSNTSGYGAAWVNAGEMTNKGVELMLNVVPIETASGFRWDVTFNYAKNVNQVVELVKDPETGEDILTNYVIGSWGPSINATVGESYGVWKAEDFVYHENGMPIVDDEGYFEYEPNQQFDSYLPDWRGGMLNSFSYKGIQLSALIDMQKGGTVYSVSNRYGDYSGMFTSTVGNNDKGNPQRDPVDEGGGVRANGVFADGTPNTEYLSAQAYWKWNRNIRGGNYIYDASFVKLREIKIGYSLPSSLTSKTPFKGVTVSFVGRNLAILSKNAPNIDPESAYGSGNIQGFENGQHPTSRSMGFNLNFKL